VASTVILNTIPKDKPPFCLDARTSIKEKSWIRRHKDRKKHYLTLATAQRMTEELGESTIVIDKGELLQGVLDKASIGPSAFGLVHCVYEVGVITVCCSFNMCICSFKNKKSILFDFRTNEIVAIYAFRTNV
jgi:hypothetical protein